MHTANELTTKTAILDSDGATTLSEGVPCGVTDLSGRALAKAQLEVPETTHMVLTRASDSRPLKQTGYLLCEGVLYIVDFISDPRKPRPRTWSEIFCHVVRVAA